MIDKSELWLACLISFAYLFGKRINELLKVTREEVEVKNGYLYVRFLVSKKKRALSRLFGKAIDKIPSK